MSHREADYLGRIQCLYLQARKEKQIVRRAPVAMVKESQKRGPPKSNSCLEASLDWLRCHLLRKIFYFCYKIINFPLRYLFNRHRYGNF